MAIYDTKQTNVRIVNYIRTYHKRRILFLVCVFFGVQFLLMVRLVYLMVFQADHFGVLAQEIQERERSIKAERGRIFDRNGIELASNKPVCTISVIYNQVKEPDRVIEILVKELGLEREYVEKRVRKKSSREKNSKPVHIRIPGNFSSHIEAAINSCMVLWSIESIKLNNGND